MTAVQRRARKPNGSGNVRGLSPFAALAPVFVAAKWVDIGGRSRLLTRPLFAETLRGFELMEFLGTTPGQQNLVTGRSGFDQLPSGGAG